MCFCFTKKAAKAEHITIFPKHYPFVEWITSKYFLLEIPSTNKKGQALNSDSHHPDSDISKTMGIDNLDCDGSYISSNHLTKWSRFVFWKFIPQTTFNKCITKYLVCGISLISVSRRPCPVSVLSLSLSLSLSAQTLSQPLTSNQVVLVTSPWNNWLWRPVLVHLCHLSDLWKWVSESACLSQRCHTKVFKGLSINGFSRVNEFITYVHISTHTGIPFLSVHIYKPFQFSFFDLCYLANVMVL